MNNQKTVNVKNAFPLCHETHKAFADENGTIRVFDSVAGHYTIMHHLTEKQEEYVRRMTMKTRDKAYKVYRESLEQSENLKDAAIIADKKGYNWTVDWQNAWYDAVAEVGFDKDGYRIR